jgi:hypothetical protein
MGAHVRKMLQDMDIDAAITADFHAMVTRKLIPSEEANVHLGGHWSLAS